MLRWGDHEPQSAGAPSFRVLREKVGHRKPKRAASPPGQQVSAGRSRREAAKIAPGWGPHGFGVPSKRTLLAGVKGQVFVRGVAGWSAAQSGECLESKRLQSDSHGKGNLSNYAHLPGIISSILNYSDAEMESGELRRESRRRSNRHETIMAADSSRSRREAKHAKERTRCFLRKRRVIWPAVSLLVRPMQVQPPCKPDLQLSASMRGCADNSAHP